MRTALSMNSEKYKKYQGGSHLSATSSVKITGQNNNFHTQYCLV